MALTLNIESLQLKNKTAAQWTSDNTVLKVAEVGVENDTGKFKIGDGATAWNSLGYAGGGSGTGVSADLDQRTFSDTLTGPAGQGEIRFNNLSNPTEIYVHEDDLDGDDWSETINLLTNGSRFKVIKSDDDEVYMNVQVTSQTDNTGSHTIVCTKLESKGTFSNGDTVSVSLDILNRGALLGDITNESAISIDKSGTYNRYIPPSDFVPIFTNLEEGNWVIVQLEMDGNKAIIQPVGSIQLEDSFVDGQDLPAGNYELIARVSSGKIKLLLNSEGVEKSALTQLNAPTGLIEDSVTGTSVTFSFTNNNSSPAEENNLVQYKLQTEPTVWTDGVTVAAGATQAIQTGLTEESDYDFRVIAKGNLVTTSDSNPSAVLQASTSAASTAPVFIGVTMSPDNTFIDVEIDQGVWRDAGVSLPLLLTSLTYTFAANGGTATNWTESSIKKPDAPLEGDASALTGGEGIVRVFGSISGVANGQETVTVAPASGASVYNAASQAMDISESAFDNLSSGQIVAIAVTDGSINTASLWNWNNNDGLWSENLVDGRIEANFDHDTIGDNNNYGLDVLQSHYKINSGVACIQANMEWNYPWSGNRSAASQLVLRCDVGNNYLARMIHDNVNDTHILCQIRINNTNQYSVAHDIGFAGSFTPLKIEFIFATNTVNFYYWNGSSWSSLTSQVYDISNGGNIIRGYLKAADNTGAPDITRCYYDNIYYSNFQYSVLDPTTV